MDEYSIKVSNELTVPRSMGEELGNVCHNKILLTKVKSRKYFKFRLSQA
jgi:hypothetical protein